MNFIFNFIKSFFLKKQTITMKELKDLNIIEHKLLTIEDLARPNFKPNEFFRSDTAIKHGIRNTTQDQDVLKNLMVGANKVQDLRNFIKKEFGDVPLIITSGYRCKELNALVGGDVDSFHLRGMALDIRVPGFSLDWLLDKITSSRISFDKILVEPKQGIIHIQWYNEDRFNREFVGNAKLINGDWVVTKI